MYSPYRGPYNRIDRHTFWNAKDFDTILAAYNYEPPSKQASRRLPPLYGEARP
jgi:hypothetical protein